MTTEPSAVELEQASVALIKGAVVVIPTDTVYGLAVLASSTGALRRIFELKGRPLEFALPVLVSGFDQASGVVKSTARLRALAEHFWPGPLTIVARIAGPARLELGGRGDTVGVRCPADDAVRELCRTVGPLAVTSANRHGEPPATSASAVRAAFGEGVAMVLDGGRRNRPPSTVVSIVDGEHCLLRSGSISLDELEAVLRTVTPEDAA